MTKLRGLVLYDLNDSHAETMRWHLASIQASRFVEFEMIPPGPSIPKEVSLSEYDVIVLHYSWNPVVSPIHPETLLRISESSARKIWIVQDDYRRINRTNELAIYMGISEILTPTPEKFIPRVYGEAVSRGISVTTVLTGYAAWARGTERFDPKPPEERVIDVSYRGRQLPKHMGPTASEKMEIGVRAKKVAKKLGLRSDIEFKESARVYGEEWQSLLLKSKACLGVESSASTLDFSGHLETGRSQLWTSRMLPRAIIAGTQEEACEPEPIKVISPRIFEYIQNRCAMFLLDGEYSGILKNGKHYIGIHPDYSNLQSALSLARNQELLLALTTNAYRDVIESGLYSHGRLTMALDSIVNPSVTQNLDARNYASPEFMDSVEYFMGSLRKTAEPQTSLEVSAALLTRPGLESKAWAIRSILPAWLVRLGGVALPMVRRLDDFIIWASGAKSHLGMAFVILIAKGISARGRLLALRLLVRTLQARRVLEMGYPVGPRSFVGTIFGYPEGFLGAELSLPEKISSPFAFKAIVDGKTFLKAPRGLSTEVLRVVQMHGDVLWRGWSTGCKWPRDANLKVGVETEF